MSGSNRRTANWMFWFLIFVSAAVTAQQVPQANISQDAAKLLYGPDVIGGYYLVTIIPGINDDARMRIHFDSCRNLEDVSPFASFAYPAGVAGFRYMLCTTRSEELIIGRGVRPLTKADLAKLGLQDAPPERSSPYCVWTPPARFVRATVPGEDPANDTLLVATTINFFYGRYGKDNVSVESKDVEHGHIAVTISNLRDTILERLGLWEWLQVNVVFGRRGEERFFQMNAEGRYASGAGSKPPPSTAFAGMEPQYHEQLEAYALRLRTQLQDYLSISGK